MFENLFASYNKVSPPENMREQITEPYDTVAEIVDVQDYNPIAQTYIESVSPVQTVVNDTTSKKVEEKPSQKKEIKASSKQTLKGTDDFENAFAKAVQRDPSVAKYKNFLTKTAKRESRFDHSIQNQAGAPYYGYFQMGQNEIKSTTGLTVDQFRNDPVAQIIGAAKLYESNLNTIKKIGVYEIGKSKGYSDDALVSGAWMGGPGGVKKYLLGLGDPSDSHWYNGQGGSSVGKIMNNWKANE